jgi:hypothetical protein
MNDAKKTKAQLIEELETERRKSAGVDVSGVERQLAVERVRAEGMAMRSSDDLLKVVGVIYREMLRLGVDAIRTTISFVDEETNRVRGYHALLNPKKYGLSWSSEGLNYLMPDVVRTGGISELKKIAIMAEPSPDPSRTALYCRLVAVLS